MGEGPTGVPYLEATVRVRERGGQHHPGGGGHAHAHRFNNVTLKKTGGTTPGGRETCMIGMRTLKRPSA